MKDNALKIIGTFATSAAMIASMQNCVLADDNTLNTASTITGTITADVLNVRANPNTSSTIIGNLKYNSNVTILEITDGWYKINYNNNTGWVSSDFVTINSSTPELPSTSTGIVEADVLNIRSGAGTSYSVTGTVNKGATVTILSSSNGWYKISYNGTTGYVSSEYIRTSSGSDSSSNSGSNSNNSNNNSSNTSGIVTADILNIRSGASTSHSVIGTVTNNSKVEILSSENGWYKINYNNIVGYVSSDYVNISDNSSNSENNNSNNNSNDNSTTVNNKGVVTADALNVRSGAGTSYGVIAMLYQNTSVDVLSSINGWYKISYNGVTGYVSCDYIKLSDSSGTITPPTNDIPSHTVEGKVAIVKADALNIRSGAGTSYSVIGTVRYGNKLPIISYTNGWYQVKAGNITGYVSGDYVTVSDEGNTTAPLVKETPLISASFTGMDIVNKAKEYIGVPYLWGGFTPMGFDCSGLVQYVYKQFGINLERTTYYQVHQGQIVEKSNLREGDLIFFTTNDDDPNDISHVGIYVGNDMFIQSPKPGDTVRISNLNSAYYTNRYYVAKRIIQ